ncbi:MAG: hypothetical protein QM500_03920 [Methylococcales bacterium]
MTTTIQTATIENSVFPNIKVKVKLTHHDENIFSVLSVLSVITQVLKKHNVSENDLSQFRKELLGSN